MHERKKKQNTLATKAADDPNQRRFESATGPAFLLTPLRSGHFTDLYRDHLPLVPVSPLRVIFAFVLLCNTHMIITVLLTELSLYP